MAGAGAIVLLASIGTPGKEEESIDRHTGRRVLVVRGAGDVLFAARATGDAQKALNLILEHREAFPDEVLDRFEAVLAAELSDPFVPPPPAHPDRAVIEAELARARERQAELARRIGERLDTAALLALLSDLEADAALGGATERFFAPLARWPEEHAQGPAWPDELAVRTLARLDDPDHVPTQDEIHAVAQAFRAQNRPRARLRWLLRLFGAFPSEAPVREAVLAAYLERGRTTEAFLVVGSALKYHPDDLDLWNHRARMAGWVSRPNEEAEAREVLLRANEDLAARERLVTLYTSAGRAAEAIPHARVLARGSTDPAVLERPALLALEAGLVDDAIAIYEELANAAEDPVPWREKILACASQDLRVERVIAELKLLAGLRPDGGYEKQLEGIYRRRNMVEELCGLLDARLRALPADESDIALEEETMALHALLGHEARVQEILVGRIRRVTNPRLFFEDLATYRSLGVPDLEETAQAMAGRDGIRPEDVVVILEAVRPYLEEPAYERVARTVAGRFPAEPVARDFLIYLVDRGADDRERAANARALVQAHPDQAAFLKAWIERASWAGDGAAELEARELWHVHHPDDVDNRLALARLLTGANRAADAVEHWREAAERDGIGSTATLGLIEALFAADRLEEAMALLEQRASMPEATVADRIHVADQLFGAQRFDRALRFYAAALEQEPEHPYALLRSGQIRSWTNDPRGAIPFLERRLAVTDEDAAVVQYYLGEAHWAIKQDDQGRRYHRRALAELGAREGRTLDQDIMVAKMLARFGRIDEAQPLFESILERKPDAVHLVLDYGDAMVAILDVPKARELADRARTLQPDLSRAMGFDGRVALLEGRYEDAARILAATIERHGPDAGTESELGRAHELAGSWTPAAEAYRRSLALQPGNRDVARSFQRLADRLAGLVHASLGYRSAGDDSALELWASGSAPLDDRSRASVALGLSRYVGRAAAVNNGLTDVEESVAHVQGSYYHRFGRRHAAGGGAAVYAGAEGNLPVGLWADLLLAETEPGRSLWVQVFGNLLLEAPTAAVGLGGRRSGVRVRGHHDIGERFWAGAEIGYASLSIDRPAGGSARNGLVDGVVTFGWRALEGETRVADPVRVNEAALPGLVGPHLAESTKDSGTHASVWVSFQTLRLLGDRELAALIPVGERFNYLVAAGRADFHLSRGVGVKVEGYLGRDLSASSNIFGLEGGLTWRPSHKTEFTCAAGYGTALGRSEDTESFLFRIGFTHRW